ncbi:hypothetical protein M758_7G184100, partial [Ceratodon purpureus]
AASGGRLTEREREKGEGGREAGTRTSLTRTRTRTSLATTEGSREPGAGREGKEVEGDGHGSWSLSCERDSAAIASPRRALLCSHRPRCPRRALCAIRRSSPRVEPISTASTGPGPHRPRRRGFLSCIGSGFKSPRFQPPAMPAAGVMATVRS